MYWPTLPLILILPQESRQCSCDCAICIDDRHPFVLLDAYSLAFCIFLSVGLLRLVVDLRFCSRFLLFKYRTGRSDRSSSLYPHYVYLTASVRLLANDSQEAFFWPIALNHLSCNTHRLDVKIAAQQNQLELRLSWDSVHGSCCLNIEQMGPNWALLSVPIIFISSFLLTNSIQTSVLRYTDENETA